MRFSVVKKNDEKTQMIAEKFIASCTEKGLIYDEKLPDVVISIGGDGTLLNAFHRYAHQLDHVRFVGVHTGHLGFYTDWRDYEYEDLVTSLLHDEGKSVTYPLLDVTINYHDEQASAHFLALNESTFKQVSGTMVLDIYIKDQLFERFRGDGICISTPTGSTAYNKSIGGAVLHPRLEALQLAEIASINNRVFRTLSSAMILAPDEWITVKPAEQNEFLLGIDQFTHQHTNISEINYRIATERIHFAHYRHTSFWRRVEDAFIGAREKNEI
ncbi:NAD+ kinase [Isobaculum melis]|uniref:NAD kinase n=2 Tax=Isobaculum melis TaxID=142588 RepID=A0A1H9T9I2_9LACT|nr:NAD kinase [Isobaculum melis]SER93778.1 NAD+ kinase [Isobaculum melis]